MGGSGWSKCLDKGTGSAGLNQSLLGLGTNKYQTLSTAEFLNLVLNRGTVVPFLRGDSGMSPRQVMPLFRAL
jgi:hypothetical protein